MNKFSEKYAKILDSLFIIMMAGGSFYGAYLILDLYTRQ